MTAAKFKLDLFRFLSTLDNIYSCEMKMDDISLMITKINDVDFKINGLLINEILINDVDCLEELNMSLIHSNIKEKELVYFHEILYKFKKFRDLYEIFPSHTFNRLLKQEGLDKYIYSREARDD